MKLALALLVLLALGYAGLCAALYLHQDRLLFFPATAPGAGLAAHAKQIGLDPWLDARGERIGWKTPDAPPGTPPPDALIFCHGNGGLALNEQHASLGRAGFQMFLLEYPGYGDRPGEVSARSFVAAALDAVDSLAAADPRRRIFLLGQSLGSGVACAATAARPGKISGLVLFVPFDSLVAAAGSHYPWLPVGLLLRHHLDSDKNLANYRGPVAFLIAGQDTTIPPRHGQRLYDLYQGPKRLVLVPDAGHNSFDELFADWPKIGEWLRTTAPANAH